jgi:hypothetical protein
MAEVSQRAWRIPGQRTKRLAWGYTITLNGKRTKAYRSEWTREDAEKALAAVQLQIDQSKPADDVLMFGQAVERYLQAKAHKRSLKEITRCLALFTSRFGADAPLSSVTASRISAAAVNRPLQMLKALTPHGPQRVGSPAIGASHSHGARARGPSALAHPEEAERLLAECRASRNTDLVDLVEFSLFTGLRQAEALGLAWERVERSRGVVLLEVTKSGKRRGVPLNGRADAVLLRRGQQSSGLVFGSSRFAAFRSSWEYAVERAKLVDFHWHDLRHTFASWSVQMGASLQEVKDLLGHSNLAMTLRYAHLAPSSCVRRSRASMMSWPSRRRSAPRRAQAGRMSPRTVLCWSPSPRSSCRSVVAHTCCSCPRPSTGSCCWPAVPGRVATRF